MTATDRRQVAVEMQRHTAYVDERFVGALHVSPCSA
jgi:hypothetical protein